VLGAFVFVGGADCWAGLAFGLDHLAGLDLVRRADFWVFLDILCLLETPKGPAGPLVRWLSICICGRPGAVGRANPALRGVVRSLCPGRERLDAFHQRVCDNQYITSSFIDYC